ncbi:MAG: hypothetical protein ABIQ86_01280 [Steroidobacteraceae bacterium]
MSESMEVTRRQLRRYLLPAADNTIEHDDDGDHFPRSKVMRFAFNPRNRRILMVSGSVLAVLVTRVVGVNRLGLVTDVARSFMRKKG